MKKASTSWESVSTWYSSLVKDHGHYYHKQVIFPKLLSHLKTKKRDASLLDMGCGTGVLSKEIGKNYEYVGVDLSKSFIQSAKQVANPRQDFLQADICNPLDLEKKNFSHCVFVLSFQNLESPEVALSNAKKHLKQGGTLILVLNHPCFRVPRQSSWDHDNQKKIQFRRIDQYMSSLCVPIQTNPGSSVSKETYSFHHSLSKISEMLYSSGFSISLIEEWTSNKKSHGRRAREENAAREEFPLFMTIIAKSL